MAKWNNIQGSEGIACDGDELVLKKYATQLIFLEPSRIPLLTATLSWVDHEVLFM